MMRHERVPSVGTEFTMASADTPHAKSQGLMLGGKFPDP